MSTWVAPITWTSSQTVTASQMNGLRDNLTFLKGSLDLITQGTTADVGNTTYLFIATATSTNTVLAGRIVGDTNYRFILDGQGRLNWGDGASAADTVLYRSEANMLRTDTGFGAANLQALAGVVDITQSAAAPYGVAGNARIYSINNGGKTELLVIFGSGVAQSLAIEP